MAKLFLPKLKRGRPRAGYAAKALKVGDLSLTGLRDIVNASLARWPQSKARWPQSKTIKPKLAQPRYRLFSTHFSVMLPMRGKSRYYGAPIGSANVDNPLRRFSLCHSAVGLHYPHGFRYA
jgi:hypothetical protein